MLQSKFKKCIHVIINFIYKINYIERDLFIDNIEVSSLHHRIYKRKKKAIFVVK